MIDGGLSDRSSLLLSDVAPAMCPPCSSEAREQHGAPLPEPNGRLTLPDSGGYFVEPTIFDGVDNSMRIAREEIFGPVISTIAFDTEEEGLAIANDTSYGLHAAVYTNDLDTAIRAARTLRAGTVSVNAYRG